MKRVKSTVGIDNIPSMGMRYQPIEMNTLSLFPINIHRAELKLPFENIITDIRNEVEKMLELQGDEDRKNYTNYFDENVRQTFAEKDWMSSIVTQLKDTYVELMGSGYGNKQVYDCTRDEIDCFIWVNRYQSEHSHPRHNHKGTTMSGTLYIKVDEDTSPIMFQNPNEPRNFIFDNRDEMHRRHPEDIDHQCQQIEYLGTRFSTNQIIYHPVAGEVLIWPSWLEHEVPKGEHDDDYERISISFNLTHTKRYKDNSPPFNYKQIQPLGDSNG
jgi:uncharacterized protein (TIGR02466 family)